MYGRENRSRNLKKFILTLLFISFLVAGLPSSATTIRYSSPIARMHATPPNNHVSVSRYGHNSKGRYVSNVSARNYQIRHGYTQSGKIQPGYEHKIDAKHGYNANGRYTAISKSSIYGQNSRGRYVPVSDNANVIKYGYDAKGKLKALQVAVKDAED